MYLYQVIEYIDIYIYHIYVHIIYIYIHILFHKTKEDPPVSATTVSSISSPKKFFGIGSSSSCEFPVDDQQKCFFKKKHTTARWPKKGYPP